MKQLLKTGLFILALTSITIASAAELGRLFFTPEQRAQLDRGIPQEKSQDDANLERTLTINGIVQRDGGKRTAWINGVPQVTGDSDQQTPDSMQVAIPGQSKPIKLKVGQKVLINPPAVAPPAEKK
jgi:hypothetical protein